MSITDSSGVGTEDEGIDVSELTRDQLEGVLFNMANPVPPVKSNHKVVLTIITLDDQEGLTGDYPQWEIRNLDETDAYMVAMGLKNFVTVDMGHSPGMPTPVGPGLPDDPDDWPDDNPPIGKAKVTAAILNVRDGPSTSAEIAGTYEQGAIVYLFEAVKNDPENRTWYMVAADRWVAEEWIEVLTWADDRPTEPEDANEVFLPDISKGV